MDTVTHSSAIVSSPDRSGRTDFRSRTRAARSFARADRCTSAGNCDSSGPRRQFDDRRRENLESISQRHGAARPLGRRNNTDRRSMTDNTRIEKDPLGELAVPADALYGVQTLRAVQNFPISGLKPLAGVRRRDGSHQASRRDDAQADGASRGATRRRDHRSRG